ncbi:hypothetical protein FGO68_gene1933 [Halteria grandinella]|uniref:Uncharacterized protein n=1 Tax=Halteria grandinella TaxID=5974 RepID=A0A8J8NUQ2_HALGN|nr:hypothetical protein FGO68_gene1933 [Halteria grandinella]
MRNGQFINRNSRREDIMQLALLLMELLCPFTLPWRNRADLNLTNESKGIIELQRSYSRVLLPLFQLYKEAQRMSIKQNPDYDYFAYLLTKINIDSILGETILQVSLMRQPQDILNQSYRSLHLDAKFTNLLDQEDHLNKKIKEQNAAYGIKLNECERLDQQIFEYKEILTNLKQQMLSVNQDNIDQLSHTIGKKIDYQTFKCYTQEKIAFLEKLNSDLSAKQKEHNSLQAMLGTLKLEHTQLQQNIKSGCDRLQTLDQHIQQHQKMLDSFEERLNDAQDAIESLELQRQAKQEDVNQLEEAYSQNCDEVKEKMRELMEVRKKIQQSQDHYGDQDEMQRIKLREIDDEIAERSKQLESQTIQQIEMAASYEMLKQNMIELYKKIEDLQKEVHDKNKS